MPASLFPQTTDVHLSPVDPASIPAAPGAFLDSFVFTIRGLSDCGGSDLGQLPSAVNLGIAYNVPADKASLRIARWDGARWNDVPTVADPDPNKPYVSATIQATGTYAVYQAP